MDSEQFGFVGIDTETNGLSPKRCEILEVYAQEYNLSGVLGDCLHFFCDSLTGIFPDNVMRHNKIEVEKIKGLPTYLTGGIREKIKDFIGNRTLVGHNILRFDIHFLKVEPVAIIDTIDIARSLFSGSVALSSLCGKLNIDFDKDKAHGAKYDTMKTIEAHIKMNKMKGGEVDFHQLSIIDKKPKLRLGADLSMSYSKIKEYQTCPLKFAVTYLSDYSFLPNMFLNVGTACHKIVEEMSKKTFEMISINKINAFLNKKSIKEDARKIYNTKNVSSLGFSRYADLMLACEDLLYEKSGKPDYETYNAILTEVLSKSTYTKEEVKDINFITNYFYNHIDFSTMFSYLMMPEKKISFDSNFNVVDVNSSDVFFKIKCDLITYDQQKNIHIWDYKTSREIHDDVSIKSDIQVLLYTMGVAKLFEKTEYNKIFFHILYIRKNITITYEVDELKTVIDTAQKIVRDTYEEIKNKKSIEAYYPRRNRYCCYCEMSGNGMCPLFFDIGLNNDFNVRNTSDCIQAWKQVEYYKACAKELTKQCKSFIKSSHETVEIDGLVLDFNDNITKKVDALELAKYLCEKKVKSDEFLQYFSISNTDYQKIKKKLYSDISEGDEKKFLYNKISIRFGVETDDECD